MGRRPKRVVRATGQADAPVEQGPQQGFQPLTGAAMPAAFGAPFQQQQQQQQPQQQQHFPPPSSGFAFGQAMPSFQQQDFALPPGFGGGHAPPSQQQQQQRAPSWAATSAAPPPLRGGWGEDEEKHAEPDAFDDDADAAPLGGGAARAAAEGEPYTDTDGSDTEDERDDQHAGATADSVRQGFVARSGTTGARAARWQLERLLRTREPPPSQARKKVSTSALSAAGGDRQRAQLIFSKPSAKIDAASLSRQSNAFAGSGRRPEAQRIPPFELPDEAMPQLEQLNRDAARHDDDDDDDGGMDGGDEAAAAGGGGPRRFLVPQFRGYHDSREHTDHDGRHGRMSRATLRAIDPVGLPVYSPAAHELAGIPMRDYQDALHQHQESERADAEAGRAPATQEAQEEPSRLDTMHEALGRAAQAVAEHSAALRRRPNEAEAAEMGGGAGQAMPTLLSHRDTQLYSQKYHDHAAMRAAGPEARGPYGPLSRHYAQLRAAHGDDDEERAVTGNPRVSTGDVPTHANAYAMGEKAYGPAIQHTLNPEYDAEGVPRHPYSGRMHISLHPPEDYVGPTAPEHLVSMQNAGEISLPQTIIPERETPFLGGMPADRVVATRTAKWPNLRKRMAGASAARQSVLLNKYGLDPELHDLFGDAMRGAQPGTAERTHVEKLLSNVITSNHDVEAMATAHAEAAARGASLVVRTGPQTFGRQLPGYRAHAQDDSDDDDGGAPRRRARAEDEPGGRKRAASAAAARAESPSSSDESGGAARPAGKKGSQKKDNKRGKNNRGRRKR